MATAPADPTAARFLHGLALLNAGEAFDAHEVWEELWLESGGARARFLQGMIQLAVAMHHWQARRWEAARRLLARAETKLATPQTPGMPPWCSSEDALAWSEQVFASLRAAKQTGKEALAPPPLNWPRCGPDQLAT